jgi:protein-arginine kinase activator protein McsA
MVKYLKGEKMRNYTMQAIMEPVEDTIVCNKCGKTYNLNEECLEEWQADFMKNFKVSFGYGSIRDGQQIEFDICEECLFEFVETFKIPVSIENWLE